jgi:putative redox protein
VSEPTREQVTSDGLALEAYLARPPGLDPTYPGLVLCHGFPSGVVHASSAAASFPQLAERIASEVGWVVLSLTFRGAGESEGDFSLQGWLDDLGAAIGHVQGLSRVKGVWVAGYGTGGALCICAGADRDDVEGVAALGSPADFDDWASHPRRLLQHSRDMGLIKTQGFPTNPDSWNRGLRSIRPADAAARLQPKPLMIVHGSDDEAVPALDARILGDAHGSAELRIIAGAGHQLRYDPRAMAVLFGWLDRQKHRVTT